MEVAGIVEPARAGEAYLGFALAADPDSCPPPVEAIDSALKRVTLSDGQSLPYDKLLLATGATPRRLPDVPESGRIFYLRTFAHALSLRPWMT